MEWITPCNIKMYDVIGAFKELKNINWKQSTNIEVGDTLYIYIGEPIQAIKYETKVIKINLEKTTIDDSKYIIDGTNFQNHGRYMEIKLIREFDKNIIPYHLAKENGLYVEGPNRVKSELKDFILYRINE